MAMFKKKRRFCQKGRLKKRFLAAAVTAAVVGTTASAAHSLVLPMLMDESIAQRAANVFTYQNQVSASLAETIMLAESHDLPLLDALYTVEEQLNEACGPLQEAGRRHIEGEDVGGLLQLAVLNAMDGCEAKSEEVAYYVRLARSYSEKLTEGEDGSRTQLTAWD